MTLWRTKVAAVLVVGVFSSGPWAVTEAVGQAGAAAAASGLRDTRTAQAPPDRNDSGPFTVTLVTGDRVTVASAQATTASVQRGRGRERMSFAVQSDGEHLYVIPGDARRLVQSGKVDRRLFDVKGLIRAGYHDAGRATLPLILGYRGGADRTADTAVSRAGAKVTRALPAVKGAAVTADKAKVATLWQAVTANRDNSRADTAGGVGKVWLDGNRKVLLDKSVPQIGAPAAWKAGFTGKGVTVAVIDTGIDESHPDLAGKVTDEKNFTPDPNADDVYGHGTHVASTIAGTGAASQGKYKGVAPDASLISGKVCGVGDRCPESAIVAALQWAAVDKHAAVVNVSLGEPDLPEVEPAEEAINRLSAQTGTLFVVAAGNSGHDPGTVTTPGSAEAALTVGSVDSADKLSDSSSRGPRAGDEGIKPDITAPGENIVAAYAGTEMGDPIEGGKYVASSGTSMASPHVAGAAALLLQQHPGWKSGALKATLMASAKPNPALTPFEQGAGRVDVARAITQTVTADPPSVSYGLAAFPHTDDKPLTKTVTYRNTGASPAELTLTVQATGPGGKPAPAGLFALSAPKLSVPAGGTAAVQLTADTRIDAPDATYTGRLVATAGTLTVGTPFAVYKEEQRYNVTLKHLGADGNATGQYETQLRGLDTAYAAYPHTDSGTVTLRLPKGRYGVCSVIDTSADATASSQALIAAPLLDLHADTTLMLDARQAKPVNMTVPEPSAKVFGVAVDVSYPRMAKNGACQTMHPGFSGLTIGQAGARLPNDQFAITVASQWSRPGADDRGAKDSPYAYYLADTVPGRVPAGLVKHYAPSQFAVVEQNLRATGKKMAGNRIAFPVIAGHLKLSNPGQFEMAAPGTRTEYFSAAPGVQWAAQTSIDDPTSDTVGEGITLYQNPTAYRAGQRYTETWGAGPFGPALPRTAVAEDWDGTRRGDAIAAYLNLLGDAAGHPGESYTPDRHTVLYRNGVQVAERQDGFISADVPPEGADYRLESYTKGGYDGLSTQVTTVFTFRSAHTDDKTYTRLPLSVVRYTPTLDARNAAHAGKALDIPVTVQAAGGGQSTAVKDLAVEVSYDDGATWKAAPLTRTGTGWTAKVTHPDTTGFVSLRAKTSDAQGNATNQTVIRAYRIARP